MLSWNVFWLCMLCELGMDGLQASILGRKIILNAFPRVFCKKNILAVMSEPSQLFIQDKQITPRQAVQTQAFWLIWTNAKPLFKSLAESQMASSRNMESISGGL